MLSYFSMHWNKGTFGNISKSRINVTLQRLEIEKEIQKKIFYILLLSTVPNSETIKLSVKGLAKSVNKAL